MTCSRRRRRFEVNVPQTRGGECVLSVVARLRQMDSHNAPPTPPLLLVEKGLY